MSASKKIYFCEMHFYQDDIIIMSDSKNLKNMAVPKAFDPLICSCTERKMDELCQKMLFATNKPQAKSEARKRKRDPMQAIDISNETITISVENDSEEELVVKKNPFDKTYVRNWMIPQFPETKNISK